MTCINLTVVQEINNSLKQCKNNESLSQSNDCLGTESMAVILEINIFMTYLLNINKGCSQNYQ